MHRRMIYFFILLFLTSLTSCADTNPNTFSSTILSKQTDSSTSSFHEHQSDGIWHHDEQGHWHECVAKDGKKLDYSAHIFTVIVDQEATHIDAGRKHNHCSICGYDSPTESIPATGHAFDKAWHSDQDGHWHECALDGAKDKVEPHRFGEWETEKEATHAEEGKENRTCLICGFIETRSLPKLIKHTFDDTWHSDSSGHWHECNVDHEKSKIEEHVYLHQLGDDGIVHNVCSVCGYVSPTTIFEKVALTNELLKAKTTIGEEAQANSVSFTDNALRVAIDSAASADLKTIYVWNDIYEEFTFDADFEYTSLSYTGERASQLKVGTLSILYYPFQDIVKLTNGDTLLEMWEGDIPALLHIEVTLLNRTLSISISDKQKRKDPLRANTKLADGEIVKMIHEAWRVCYTLSQVTISYPIGATPIAYNPFVTEKKTLGKNDFVLEKRRQEDVITLDEGTLGFRMLPSSDANSFDYLGSATLKQTFLPRDSFVLDFTLTATMDNSYISNRSLTLVVGNCSLKIAWNMESIWIGRGDSSKSDVGTGNAIDKVGGFYDYAEGKMRITYENRALHFLHKKKDSEEYCDFIANYYFDPVPNGADEEVGVKIVAKRIAIQITDLTLTTTVLRY
jgi:hypothetical protein